MCLLVKSTDSAVKLQPRIPKISYDGGDGVTRGVMVSTSAFLSFVSVSVGV